MAATGGDPVAAAALADHPQGLYWRQASETYGRYRVWAEKRSQS